MDDAAATRYPREISITLNDPDEESVAAADARIDEMLAQEGLQAQDALRYVSLGISAVRQGDFFETDQSNVQVTSIDQIAALYFIPLADYNAQTHQERTLDAGEALVYASRTPYEDDTLSVLGKTFKVSDHLDSFMDFGFSSASLMDSYFVVVADMGVIEEVDAAQRAAYWSGCFRDRAVHRLDLDGTPQQNEQFAKGAFRIAAAAAILFIAGITQRKLFCAAGNVWRVSVHRRIPEHPLPHGDHPDPVLQADQRGI